MAGGRPKARGAERVRYQFEATGSDDELEDEIDDNLGEWACESAGEEADEVPSRSEEHTSELQSQ